MASNLDHVAPLSQPQAVYLIDADKMGPFPAATSNALNTL